MYLYTCVCIVYTSDDAVHILMNMVECYCVLLLPQIQSDIIEILASFAIVDTSSNIPTKEDGTSRSCGELLISQYIVEIGNNPWCSMLQELLTHTLNAPQVMYIIAVL